MSPSNRNAQGWFNMLQMVQRTHAFRRRMGMLLLLMTLLPLMTLCGCNGRTIKVDNPVFAAAPPRRSLVNQSADMEESRLAQANVPAAISKVGFSPDRTEPLTGTSVVAMVNGKPVFLDDVLGGFRTMLDSRPELKPEQRQMIMTEQLRRRLGNYVDQEIVLQALKAKIPEDKQKTISESLEPTFQKMIDSIKQDKGLQTDDQVEELLSKEGSSVKQLRETFIRAQMVNGYVATLASSPKSIDRQDLVNYYQSHIGEYTPAEQIRVSEIVVRFDQHGGRPGAEKVMANVVSQIESNRDFGDIAVAFSDALSAEKKGDIGVMQRGTLADTELETQLFELAPGSMTKVYVRPDRFELYKVISHTNAIAVRFEDVQKEIEELLLKQKADEARRKVVEDLKVRSDVKTMFDAA